MAEAGAPLPGVSGESVLVVGGGGFIGRHVCAAFQAAGASVRVFDLVPAPPGEPLPWITGTITDPTQLAAAADGCALVVFLANASLPGASGADLAGEVEAHVHATVRVAEVCETIGVRRFLFASSGGTVYGADPVRPSGLREGDPTLPRHAYGVSKLAIEHYLRLIGGRGAMDTVCLRVSNPYGEGQRALRAQGFVAAAMGHAMDGTPLTIWGDGSVERDFVYVRDVADAFVRAAAAGEAPPVVNIGSGVAVSLVSMVKAVEEAIGRPVRVAFTEGRAIDVRRNILDVSLAEATLGWRPATCLRDGLAQTAAWWQAKA